MNKYDSIPPALLDKALDVLIDNSEMNSTMEFSTDFLIKELDIDSSQLNVIFSIFNNQGLITDWNDRRTVFFFVLTAYSYDFYKKGGFEARYAIIEGEMKLLNEELEKIKHKISLDNISNITSIIANITKFLSS